MANRRAAMGLDLTGRLAHQTAMSEGNATNTIVDIPSRLAAMRLPNKPLVEIHGVPMIVNDDVDACPTVYGTLANGCPDVSQMTIRLEAEDYVRYQDFTAGNDGGACRNDDVDVETTTDSGGGCNIVDAKHLSATLHSGSDAGHGAGIASQGILKAKHLANHGLPGNGKEHRPAKNRQAIEMAEDGEIVLLLLGEVDPRIEKDGIPGTPVARAPLSYTDRAQIHAVLHTGRAIGTR